MNKLLPSVKSLITLAALLCFLFQASAASAQKVSLSVRNATVKAAIERLQKDYGYSFVIKTKDADVNKKITRTDRGAHGCPPDRLLPRPEDQGGCGGRSGTVL